MKYFLRLYISGITIKSNKAIKTIKTICENELDGNVTLEVIDLYQQPLSINYDIEILPTLVRVSPKPIKKIVGNLSDREYVLYNLVVNKEA